MQLVELEQYLERFRSEGLGVAAISYDTVEILAAFAQRVTISFPLLSDPESKIIQEFGILNTSVPRDHMRYGIPHPVTYIVDRQGVVKSKYFETFYRDRFSVPTILLREFGSAAGTRETAVTNDHLRMKYYSTRDVVWPNLRFTLVADFALPAKMHVYAPTVQGYIPIQLEIDSSEHFRLLPAEYPKSETFYLPAIRESVPVYHGAFRISQDIVMANSDVLEPILTGSKQITIKGKLRYQACDDKICYLPQSFPLEWTLQVDPPDRERAPEAIRHR